MKKLLLLVILFVYSQNVFSNWEHSFLGNTVTDIVASSDNLYFGRFNGITEYNLTTKNTRQITMLNSELPSNRTNAFLKMDENKYLVSTRNGLCILKNGVISANEPICLNYPDTDARKLYLDPNNRIWTFSAHKVHCYDNGNWKTINLEDSVTTLFDIWNIDFAQGDVWVMFNDNRKTQTKFYENSYIDLRINVAIISDFKISTIFDTKAEFPQRQGDYSMFDAGDFIVWKNYDSVYTYQNKKWESTLNFHHNGNKPFWYNNFVKDSKGNIWYTVSNDLDKTAYPVCYNIQKGELTAYLQNEDEKWISGVTILENDVIIAKSSNICYILKNNVWEKKVKSDFGVSNLTILSQFYYFNNKIYISVFRGNLPDGSIVNIDDGTYIPPTYQGLRYSSLSQVEVNKFGKGIFRGDNVYRDVMEYAADSGFVNLKSMLNNSSPEIKPSADGNVYFTNFKVGNNWESNYLTTWSGNDIVNIDMGFASENATSFNNFECFGDLIYGIGFYAYGEDSLNSYLSMYNTSAKTLRTFDKHNSDLPDFYIERQGLSYQYKDTVPQDITVDKENNIWIFTSMSLIKFNESGSEIFDLKYKGNQNSAYRIGYDEFSNDILLLGYDYKPLYFMNIENKQIDTFDVSVSGVIGNIIKAKKLLDNNIWASDDLGYLYKYTGNGKFKVFDLQISNRPNLKFPLNDFSIDYNRNLYLATEIGLLTNKSILSDVAENSKFSKDGLCIYPIPANDYIEISIPELNNGASPIATVQIFNTLGIEVGQSSLIDDKNRINISHLPTGVYFIKIGDKVKKFVKM